jgi:protein-tyrosine-phosphatase
MMNLLFLCKYNRFRSKVAEAFFNKLNKNPNNHAKSAGIIKGAPIATDIKEVAEKFGIKITGTPQGVSRKLLKWQEILIIVADDVPSYLFNNEEHGKKTLVWKIKDSHGASNEMEDIIKQIRKEVIKLLIEIK